MLRRVSREFKLTLRRFSFLFGIGLITALSYFLINTAPVFAQGVAKNNPIAVFNTEGRNPVYFSVSCVPSSWTLLVSSDTIARSTFIVSIASNTAAVCLSTGPTNSNSCVQGTPSDELPPNSAETVYHRAAIYCRSGAGTQTLKGHRNRDHADYGQVPIP